MSVLTGHDEREDTSELSGSSSNDTNSADTMSENDLFNSDAPRHRVASDTSNGNNSLGLLGGAMELLSEELQQEIAPRKLLRQFSLNIPPSSARSSSHGSGNGSGSGTPLDTGRRLSTRGSASPHRLDDVLGCFERHQLPRRDRGASESVAELEMMFGDTAATSAPQVPVPCASDSDQQLEPSLQNTQSDSFEAKFGHGFLGLEFVINDTRQQVMVKSVQDGSWPLNILQIPPGASITRGLIVDAINGRDVAKRQPEVVLDLLQFTQRPLTVRFRRCEESMVVCKLCECRIDAWTLDEHTNYCVMSRRFELEADQINNALTRISTSIAADLDSEAMRSFFHPEALHFYHALRVITIQASFCDVAQVESFALCSRLVKILDRIRHQELLESTNFAVETGLKYCHRIRNLVHAKMSKMRQSQKVQLQQGPSEGRAPFQRTKSLEEVENGTGPARLAAPLSSVRRPSACRVSIRDFQIVKPISKGAFGKVYLARKKTTGDQYAIKVLAKEHVLRKKQIQHIETERDILVSVESPFVVKLFWTFQTKRNLFLVMEYLPGGDFMSLLECIVQLEEQVARVYIAEVALALNHLHLKGCVHRDLKPDNILISSSGHIKLTDFGLSEEGVSMSEDETENPEGDGTFGDDPPDRDELDSSGSNKDERAQELVVERWHSPGQLDMDDDLKDLNAMQPKRTTKKKHAYSHTYGRCGTPDYLSPEIIRGEPHGAPVDYWALGVILYEMLVGFPPFNDETVEAIFGNILDRQILWPDGDKCLSPDAMDLIDLLLVDDPYKRLGWEGLQKHAFFQGLDWTTLLESTPPFVPTLEGPNDTSYFNNRNLTDIFIDDEELEFDAQSVQTESIAGEHTLPITVADAGMDNHSDELLMDSLREFTSGRGTNLSLISSPSSLSNAATVPSDKLITESSFKTDQDPSFAPSEPSSFQQMPDGSSTTSSLSQQQHSRHPQRHLQLPQSGESYLKFPSGMYSGQVEDVVMTEAFRSFSFTNMNALAAASRNEAEIIADSRLSEVENSSALSILI